MNLNNILGEGLGGIIFPPISESFGRKRAYILSTIVFCIFSGLTCVYSLPVLIIGRFITGVVTGIPATIAPGSLEDMLDAHSRIWGIFAWTSASNTGLVLGPIFSSYVTGALGW
jgi:MFS family permease